MGNTAAAQWRIKRPCGRPSKHVFLLLLAVTVPAIVVGYEEQHPLLLTTILSAPHTAASGCCHYSGAFSLTHHRLLRVHDDRAVGRRAGEEGVETEDLSRMDLLEDDAVHGLAAVQHVRHVLLEGKSPCVVVVIGNIYLLNTEKT